MTCLGAACLTPCAAAEAVRVWEAPLVLPTYEMGPPDRNPIFVERRAYQGAASPVYPYPMWDSVSDHRVEKTYSSVCLENRYVRICVLPEIGGRVISASDKTNGYDFLYRQRVIKPALIGMVGAWMSGGAEWNVPHHHRASTFMPVDYSISRYPDGSASVRVGELELRHRMRWVVELKLRPDSSCVEQTVRLINRTQEANSFLYFSNMAVHANGDYQVIFPPDTHWVTNHGKREFSRWPVSQSIYNGIDFRRGIDVSWWKSHPSPISMFAWGTRMDFVAGYDHGRRAGFVHVADHHISPGKKFFTWGAGEAGKMWDRVLTDSDGAYIELMAGSYSDNQPDYSWIRPYQTKTAEMFWYPVSQIGGVKNANREAAVNLEIAGGKMARIAVAATSERPDVTVRLSGAAGQICERKAAISPAKPFSTECAVAPDAGQLTVQVTSAGAELISYTAVESDAGEMPEPVRPPAPPQSIRAIEEVYQAGLRLEQLHSAALDPEDYYREVLRRDPGHARGNTAMGIRAYRRALYADGERYLRAAVKRITGSYMAPPDGEAHYYLGLVLRSQGRTGEARDAFERAYWVAGWESPAGYQLAELSSTAGDLRGALRHLDRALAGNAENLKALTLKAALLRHFGRTRGRAGLLARAAALDPLDPWPGWEAALASGRTTETSGDPQRFLEAAMDYAGAGLWTDAIQVLSRADGKAAAHAMVRYLLAYCLEKGGKPQEAADALHRAGEASPDYVFPFRREALAVLEWARERHPRDGRAAYYLGNILQSLGRRDEAAGQWEKSRELNPGYAIVYRNLALVYAQQGKLAQAVASMEAASARDPVEPRYYLELDQLYESAEVSLSKRLSRLEDNQQVIERRDDLLARQVSLLIETGRLERALELLKGHQFHVWEGAGRTAVHGSFVESHLRLGHRLYDAKRYREALAEYTAALEYPVNLGTGRPLRGERLPETYYYLGRTAEALGDRAAASEYYTRAVETAPAGLVPSRPDATDDPEVYYYAALAMKKCGRTGEADRIFAGLIEAGKVQLADHVPMFFFASFGYPQSDPVRFAQAHFVIGLGLLGSNQPAQAQREFTLALRLDRQHAGARKFAGKLSSAILR